MPTRQKLITGDDRREFDEEVNDHLENGWQLLGNNIGCSVARAGTQYSTSTEERWWAVLTQWFNKEDGKIQA
jgi:hypothetical protein